MFDILTAIYHDDPLQYGVACCLNEPQTTAEHQVKSQLDALNTEDVKELEARIETLAREQSELAFHRGAQFGAQITLQLLGELSETL